MPLSSLEPRPTGRTRVAAATCRPGSPRPRPLTLTRLAALAAVPLLTIAACTTTGGLKRSTTAVQRARFEKFAGPPLTSFTYLGHYYAWTPLGAHQLVLWTTPEDAYLITVQPPCVGLDFTFGIRMSAFAHTVTRRIDAVMFKDQRCLIAQIRRINYRAMTREPHGSR